MDVVMVISIVATVGVVSGLLLGWILWHESAESIVREVTEARAKVRAEMEAEAETATALIEEEKAQDENGAMGEGEAEGAEEDADDDDNDEGIEPIIYGKHFFVRYDSNETWCWEVVSLTLNGDDYRAETKKQALEIMAKADAYRDSNNYKGQPA